MNIDVTYFLNPRSKKSSKINSANKSRSSSTISINRFDLFWANIYANRENRNIADVGKRIAFDLAQVDYFFDFTSSSGGLHVNNDILNIEQTQKTAYFNRIGVIICNIVGKKYLGLKHLHNLENFRGMNVSKGKKSPDFIAQKGADYYLIEAKGTSRKTNSRQEKEAIVQLNDVATINGKLAEKLLIQTTVDKTGKILVAVVDPIGNGRNIEVTDDDFGLYKKIFFDYEGLAYKQCGDFYCVGYELDDYFVGYCEKITQDGILQNGQYFSDGTVIVKL